jgi:hypothetical protein
LGDGLEASLPGAGGGSEGIPLNFFLQGSEGRIPG